MALLPALVILLVFHASSAAGEIRTTASGAKYGVAPAGNWYVGCVVSPGLGCAHSSVDVYARTTDSSFTEVKPEWQDCTSALNLLRSACQDRVFEWKCDLLWGTCGKCGYGSCIHASFIAPSLCLSSVSVGVGPSGPTIGAGITDIGKVVTGVFGTPNCQI